MIKKFLSSLFTRSAAAQPAIQDHRERLLSGLGAAIGIALTVLVSEWILGVRVTLPLVASMGATAVLLFAVPHSAFSEPWAVLGGHAVSVAVGVISALLVDDPVMALPLAVGVSIGVMYYMRCLHPPGGGTTILVVMSGPGAHGAGFLSVVLPVAVNAIVLLAAALVFNALLRKQPRHEAVAAGSRAEQPEKFMIRHSDLVYALTEMHSFIDVTEEDLLRIYELATLHAIPGDQVARK